MIMLCFNAKSGARALRAEIPAIYSERIPEISRWSPLGATTGELLQLRLAAPFRKPDKLLIARKKSSQA